jgi:pyridoxamine 5'-phosphate oxidase family protein
METTMPSFTDSEFAYLNSKRRLGRVATVGPDGTPRVAPVGWSSNAEHHSIDIGGRRFEQTKKYRYVQRSGRAAIVIYDLDSVDSWRPCGIEIRGHAQVVTIPPR